jgi:hypothetical protein
MVIIYFWLFSLKSELIFKFLSVGSLFEILVCMFSMSNEHIIMPFLIYMGFISAITCIALWSCVYYMCMAEVNSYAVFSVSV